MSQKLEILLKQLSKLHPKYIDLSLKRLEKLLKKIDNPHLSLPKVIHIAGTNGKGSTLSFIKSILIENGFSVHAYISPHLKKFLKHSFHLLNHKVYCFLHQMKHCNYQQFLNQEKDKK